MIVAERLRASAADREASCCIFSPIHAESEVSHTFFLLHDRVSLAPSAVSCTFECLLHSTTSLTRLRHLLQHLIQCLCFSEQHLLGRAEVRLKVAKGVRQTWVVSGSYERAHLWKKNDA